MKIGFAAPTKFNPVSWLIEKVTGSRWSHCFIVLDQSVEGDYLILEDSMLGGVKINVLSNYQKNHYLEVYTVESNSYSLAPVYKYIGDNYAYLGILGELFAKIFGLKKNPITLDMVCAGLVIKFLNSGNLSNEFSKLDVYTASPEDIYQIIIKSPDFKKDA